VWHFALPVALFAYCYGRILHVVRRQRTIVGVQMDRSQGDTTATTSRDHVMVSAASTAAAKLSRKELNVLQTMIVVIVCFIVCHTPGSLANVIVSLTVCFITYTQASKKNIQL